jgi:mRNA interferase MazF
VKRGDIYSCDLGNPQGHEQGGKRPVLVVQDDEVALIIQNDLGNAYAPTTMIAVVTKAEGKTPYPFQVAIAAGEGGLPLDSIVKLEHIYTIDKTRLKQRYGRLSSPRMQEIDMAIKRSLGLK